MLIAYVDESYDQSYYFIGAAVTSKENWDRLERDYERLRERATTEHGIAPDAELHGHELMGGSGDWKPLRGKHREAADVYGAALKIAQHAGVQYLFRGVDVRRLNARYQLEQKPHPVVLQHLLERIDEYCHRSLCSDWEKVRVVADEIATQDDHRREFESYQLLGTPGYRSSRLDRISAPIRFASSRVTAGLQAVDLAVYLHRRRFTVTERHPASARTVARLGALIDGSTAHARVWTP
ncbi:MULTISPECIES: DUF3800 domain-containing protein [unclassified Rathayibacter]|uniref:DUF3800 domain-containing protein n=1 Tax=unclassified Rathayibacter TaxID=2609250 RepID=UPI001FB49A15|nr:MULTISPECIES: DUF3800 domain-containing protein [unclassified Rathayibacter]MCJ1685141.1 DUF3800 domain-containing protein [Rathayibacter sp. VKM Ac-2928]MCJ1688944.1 DUF3800 domain-containing protein [Rathayibacter sp. VKM Ac-2927]